MTSFNLNTYSSTILKNPRINYYSLYKIINSEQPGNVKLESLETNLPNGVIFNKLYKSFLQQLKSSKKSQFLLPNIGNINMLYVKKNKSNNVGANSLPNDRESYFCFYIVIEHPTLEELKDKEYWLICLIFEKKGKYDQSIELFSQDLVNYSLNVISPLIFDIDELDREKNNADENKNEENIETNLMNSKMKLIETISKWYEVTISYLSKIVIIGGNVDLNLFGSKNDNSEGELSSEGKIDIVKNDEGVMNLAILLRAAVLDLPYEYKFQETDKNFEEIQLFKRDFTQFYNMVNILKQNNKPKEEKESLIDFGVNMNNSIVITSKSNSFSSSSLIGEFIKHDDNNNNNDNDDNDNNDDISHLIISGNDALYNEFTIDWSNTLLNNLYDPFYIRHKIEHYKLSIVKYLNDIKRYINQSVYCNHDLYLLVNLLRKSKHKDIIIKILLQDKTNNEQTKEILDTIINHL
eukprot:TRINITY_DN261_c0_g3_i2.p1 TRINITY_DN261_c0_g3~~TRINITY_DN261_c0_g3_i2.p1  ORF type:complete len:465 (+),score=88.05 TRINITY_DN261_c0_g3_i2:157-1551(+)